MTPEGGFVVGYDGLALRRENGAWVDQATGVDTTLAYPSVWVDPDGGVWVVGGYIISTPRWTAYCCTMARRFRRARCEVHRPSPDRSGLYPACGGVRPGQHHRRGWLPGRRPAAGTHLSPGR